MSYCDELADRMYEKCCLNGEIFYVDEFEIIEQVPTYNDFYAMIDDVFQELYTLYSRGIVVKPAEEALQALDEYMYERLGMGEDA